jgi:hypothetical protein
LRGTGGIRRGGAIDAGEPEGAGAIEGDLGDGIPEPGGEIHNGLGLERVGGEAADGIAAGVEEGASGAGEEGAAGVGPHFGGPEAGTVAEEDFSFACENREDVAGVGDDVDDGQMGHDFHGAVVEADEAFDVTDPERAVVGDSETVGASEGEFGDTPEVNAVEAVETADGGQPEGAVGSRGDGGDGEVGIGVDADAVLFPGEKGGEEGGEKARTGQDRTHPLLQYIRAGWGRPGNWRGDWGISQEWQRGAYLGV